MQCGDNSRLTFMLCKLIVNIFDFSFVEKLVDNVENA